MKVFHQLDAIVKRSKRLSDVGITPGFNAVGSCYRGPGAQGDSYKDLNHLAINE